LWAIHRKSPQSEHLVFVASVYSQSVVRQTQDSQHPLPFGHAESSAQQAEDPGAGNAEDARGRPGRPRIWASEAERKRAYRERLAADFAEPERLRRELRAERQKVADKDRSITRLRRELARAETASIVAVSRQHDLEGTIEGLEAKVNDWRSRAQALARRREEERAERERVDRRSTASRGPAPRLELPNLATKGQPPPPARRKPND